VEAISSFPLVGEDIFIPSPLAGEGQDGGMNKNNARKLRNNPTETERFLWQHLRLRQLGGCKFRRQQPLGEYIVDFVCLEKRLVVELDGGQHSEQAGYDARRGAWIEAQGFRILRFWDHEVLREVEAVKEVIGKALGLWT
jgi:very-short-patch-repair endonuclease